MILCVRKTVLSVEKREAGVENGCDTCLLVCVKERETGTAIKHAVDGTYVAASSVGWRVLSSPSLRSLF